MNQLMLPNAVSLIVTSVMLDEMDSSEVDIDENKDVFKQAALQLSSTITSNTDDAIMLTEILVDVLDAGVDEVRENHLDQLKESEFWDFIKETTQNIDRDILDNTDFQDVLDNIDDPFQGE